VSGEPRYTLEEARYVLARVECERAGHRYEILVRSDTNVPQEILCDRCGRTWLIQPEPETRS